ncbi:MAG: 50S ribosomal protein L23 [Candidatus Levybacteria bacterium]|nr:50S ribosomal protein L23 [Candidatus Levybacteria bacterium]
MKSKVGQKAHDVFVKPIITEKSLQDAKKGKFTFSIVAKVPKNIIRQAVEKTFDVKVIGLTTSIVKGKKKRTGAKRIEREEGIWKKAIVTLSSGQTISVFGVGGDQDKKEKIKDKK